MSDGRAADGRPLANPRPFLILAGLGLAAIVVLVVLLLRPPGIPALVAEDYMDVAGGLIVAEPHRGPAELSSAVSSTGVGPLPVPNLEREGYALAGGRRHELDGRVGLLAVYHNNLQDLLVYEVWEGSTEDLPDTRDIRDTSDHQFLVHQKSTMTLVFWQDGPLVRVVASSLPTEQVVALATAAARREGEEA
jgi:hypothetical protein